MRRRDRGAWVLVQCGAVFKLYTSRGKERRGWEGYAFALTGPMLVIRFQRAPRLEPKSHPRLPHFGRRRPAAARPKRPPARSGKVEGSGSVPPPAGVPLGGPAKVGYSVPESPVIVTPEMGWPVPGSVTSMPVRS